MKRIIGLFLLMLLNFGCATLLNGRSQTLLIDSDPKGATVRSSKLNREAITPTSFSFEKGGDVYLDFSKEGYEKQSLLLDKRVAPMFWLNLLWGSLSPVAMLVDNANGSMWNYEGAVHVKLGKKPDIGNIPLTEEEKNVANQPSLFQTNPPKNRIKEGGGSGIRLGFSYLSPELIQTLKNSDKVELAPFISQFGLQFEKRISMGENRPQFVLQLIPLIGALDRNETLLSFTGLIGVRTTKGIDFGMGPMAFETAVDETRTSVAYMIGVTRNYDGMSIPLTLIVTPSKDGLQTSLLTGFSW